ncbi:MAG: hypothetical protein H6Q86_5532 [candidate division NC10 bacterium]|nr:hypothetical protein [candidate division NC10 bacterium]
MTGLPANAGTATQPVPQRGAHGRRRPLACGRRLATAAGPRAAVASIVPPARGSPDGCGCGVWRTPGRGPVESHSRRPAGARPPLVSTVADRLARWLSGIEQCPVLQRFSARAEGQAQSGGWSGGPRVDATAYNLAARCRAQPANGEGRGHPPLGDSSGRSRVDVPHGERSHRDVHRLRPCNRRRRWRKFISARSSRPPLLNGGTA